MTILPNPFLSLTEEGLTNAFHNEAACKAWWAKFSARLYPARDTSEAVALGFELEDENVSSTVDLADLLFGNGIDKRVIAGLLKRRMLASGINADDWILIELLGDAVNSLMTPRERRRLDSLPDDVVVFRLQGTGRPKIPSGLSWSIDREIARNMAKDVVNEWQDAILLKTTVCKGDITAFFDMRDEEEIIIKPALIKAENVEVVEQILYQTEQSRAD
ncbi:hypothetical protein PTE30175_01862 [Pandoraea terrae]|uniref:Uncharacterized protein n=1 Tax=Pandoraea terrae TaxID=1537710 RepID=A0A5E4UE19_9BURK|nr:hypothetical protein [Pandoraea terrae]VVD97104.1 hypothetical protein PTE30175_01862 [Pandoraea terrae]